MGKITKLSIILNVFFIIVALAAVWLISQSGIVNFTSDSEEALRDIPLFFDYGPGFEDVVFKVEVVADNLSIPWAVAHLPNNDLLVTERPGTVRLVKQGLKSSEVIYEIPNVQFEGEAGLMSIALHPDFDSNQYVYLYFSYSDGEGQTALKVSRFTYLNETLSREEIIIDRIPYGPFHAGGELKFGPDGALYITTGDVTDWNLAQDPRSLAGKTLRLNDDGSIPWDNSFVNDPNTRNEIFSLGHRNAQGISWHPNTFTQYQTDHGPSGFDGGTGMDEINLVRPRSNQGWPTIRGEESQEGLKQPIALYTPAIAPSSLEFYEGEMFPEWNGFLLVAALKGENILALEVDGSEIINEYRLFNGEYGRIRDISISPIDGSIYFTTSNSDGRGEMRENDDKIYKIIKTN